MSFLPSDQEKHQQVSTVLTDKGVIDLPKFKPVTRLDDISYSRVGDAYRITYEPNTTYMSYLCQS
ncbi:hypothetical protein DFJ58DRAFT_786758 [Suillus subalutaceus]|uniref:uncharacterized protein n=1 Tax=Suillus subalutaceus TaxID=48586 RepID=UPI001B85B834|nr:uncharacterized protein DFJ58DRAFT_786758 [Suillus subalutaceus]KAG1854931.1 hypothetical protein DFJ58DRAFT_786758 [Suillus subalutaceus]